jgi:hypothetical protein
MALTLLKYESMRAFVINAGPNDFPTPPIDLGGQHNVLILCYLNQVNSPGGFGGWRFVVHAGFGRLGMNPGYKGTMHIQSRYILTIATLAFALASGLPNVSADELKEAKVTQVIQDVRVLPSNASSRPAAVNDNVRQGTAVQTGVQSRSELTFKDQTITRLGEKTIFSVGEGPRNIDLGSGQFLLYAPKKAGGAKVKMGPVTAAITG